MSMYPFVVLVDENAIEAEQIYQTTEWLGKGFLEEMRGGRYNLWTQLNLDASNSFFLVLDRPTISSTSRLLKHCILAICDK